MKKNVTLLFIVMFMISSPLWGGNACLGTGSRAHHTITTNVNGTVYAWGYNIYGQLGDNSTTQRNTPIAVSGVLSAKTITAVATGSDHSIAATSDGTVYTGGWNHYGQLGNNSTTNSDCLTSA